MESTTYVRFTKTTLIPIEEGESIKDAIERADILDSDGALEYQLITEIVDEAGDVIEEV